MLRLSIENGGVFCDIVDTLLTVGSGLEKKTTYVWLVLSENIRSKPK